jgi:hypothetical protein
VCGRACGVGRWRAQAAGGVPGATGSATTPGPARVSFGGGMIHHPAMPHRPCPFDPLPLPCRHAPRPCAPRVACRAPRLGCIPPAPCVLVGWLHPAFDAGPACIVAGPTRCSCAVCWLLKAVIAQASSRRPPRTGNGSDGKAQPPASAGPRQIGGGGGASRESGSAGVGVDAGDVSGQSICCGISPVAKRAKQYIRAASASAAGSLW